MAAVQDVDFEWIGASPEWGENSHPDVTRVFGFRWLRTPPGLTGLMTLTFDCTFGDLSSQAQVNFSLPPEP